MAAFNERMAYEFQEEGHQVILYNFTLQYPGFLFPGKTQFKNSQPPENLNIRREVNSINPANWILTGKKIRKENPDMVIFSYWMAFMAPCFGTIARIIKKKKGIKCIGLIHNMIPHEPSILDKLFPSWFVNSMDGFIALSRSVVDDISKFDKKNKPKRIYPHPLYDSYGEIIDRNTALNRLDLSTEKNYILFFGFIREYKGLDLLLDAFADQRLRKYNIRLIIAGEFYGNEAFYMNKIKNLELETEIVLRTHFISDSEVNAYFCAADIIVQPYRSATQSGVTQIAYHFNKPVLTTNVGGLPEIVPHKKTGYVVEVNPSSIAEALIDFYENKREIAFVENVKKEKEKYTWANLVKTIIHI